MIDALIRTEILELFRDKVLKRIEDLRASIAKIRHEPKPTSEMLGHPFVAADWKKQKQAYINPILSELSELNERLRVTHEWLAELLQGEQDEDR